MSASTRKSFASTIALHQPLVADIAFVQTDHDHQDRVVEIHGDVFLDAQAARALADHLYQLADRLG